jgi:hypothetical protein
MVSVELRIEEGSAELGREAHYPLTFANGRVHTCMVATWNFSSTFAMWTEMRFLFWDIFKKILFLFGQDMGTVVGSCMVET